MEWSKAFKLAIPVWLLVCGAIVAINHVAASPVGVTYVILGVAVAYPVTAFIVTETAGDIAKWRAAFGSKSEK